VLRLTLLLLACLTACSYGQAPCTLRAGLEGVHVEVDQAVAARAGHLAMEVCWDGACRRSSGELMPSTRVTGHTCEGEACSATAVRTGGKFGFGTISGLPKRPVEVRLTLGDGGSEPVLTRTIRVTPRATFPNGPDCGEGAPQVTLTVAADGTVRER
jgi:hypothetical protein